jgi:hypothetical protein
VRRATKLGELYIHFEFYQSRKAIAFYFLSILYPLRYSKEQTSPSPKLRSFCILGHSTPFHILLTNPHHKVLNLSPLQFLILLHPLPSPSTSIPISQPRKNQLSNPKPNPYTEKAEADDGVGEMVGGDEDGC